MINANELRIGNLVLDDEGTEVKIESLRTKEFNDWNGGDDHETLFSKNGELCWSSPVFGIPLSEEWLLRFGFEYIPHFTVMNSMILPLKRNRHISIGCVGTPNESAWLCNLDGKRVTDLVCIHNWDYDGPLYVHLLQNIVKDLAKTELKLKK